MSQFKPGNQIGKLGGRPKGARNKLDSVAYSIALAHVQHRRGEPVPPEFEKTNLWIALETTLRTQPAQYVKSIISMLPKEVQMDYTVTRLTEVDKLIEALEAQIAAAEEQESHGLH